MVVTGKIQKDNYAQSQISDDELKLTCFVGWGGRVGRKRSPQNVAIMIGFAGHNVSHISWVDITRVFAACPLTLVAFQSLKGKHKNRFKNVKYLFIQIF